MNLLSEHAFDRMPAAFRETLHETPRSGRQADGTHLQFYGEVTAEGRIGILQPKYKFIVGHIRDDMILERFIVGQIRDDMILERSFLVNQGCVIRFGDPSLELGGIRFAYTDQRGRPLQSGIQVSRMAGLLLRQERILQCNLVSPNFPPKGLVESVSRQLLVATSLHRPREDQVLFIHCLNPHEGPVQVPAGLHGKRLLSTGRHRNIYC